MCVEIWKDIKGYEGSYMVSNNGNVKSIDRINYCGYHYKEHILKQVVDRNGYCRVYLTKRAKTKCKLVHILVAQSFIPNPNNLPEINHKDENKANNCVDNLEWCTHQYNSNYGTRTSRIIPKTIDKTRTPVDQYDLNDNMIKEWYSMSEAARQLNIVQQNISKCCHGKRNIAGGFKWKFHKREGDE